MVRSKTASFDNGRDDRRIACGSNRTPCDVSINLRRLHRIEVELGSRLDQRADGIGHGTGSLGLVFVQNVACFDRRPNGKRFACGRQFDGLPIELTGCHTT